MPDSDRKKIKDQQKGEYKTAAVMLDVGTAVGDMHSETYIFDVPADANVAEIGVTMPFAGRLKAVQGLAVTGLAVNGSAYVTQTVQKRAVIAGVAQAAVIASTFNTNTAGQNKAITAWVGYDFTPSLTPANVLFNAGDVLTFSSTETGAPTTPIGKVRVTVEYGAV